MRPSMHAYLDTCDAINHGLKMSYINFHGLMVALVTLISWTHLWNHKPIFYIFRSLSFEVPISKYSYLSRDVIQEPPQTLGYSNGGLTPRTIVFWGRRITQPRPAPWRSFLKVIGLGHVFLNIPPFNREWPSILDSSALITITTLWPQLHIIRSLWHFD